MPTMSNGVALPEGFPIGQIDEIVADLIQIEGVVAIVLGGSWASGRQRPDSDVDIGVCYRAYRPLDINGVRQVARRFNDTPDPVVTGLGGWGPWVNGGAWLTIQGQRLDFIYRDLDLVTSTIEECLAGRSRADYWQQAPYGFHSQVYCAEARCCIPLYDPDGIVGRLKALVQAYPPALKQRRVSGWLWGAGFTLAGVKHATDRGEAYLVAGYLARAMTELIQALYAINETYFMNDKYVYRDVSEFRLAPRDFMSRVDALMGGDNSPADLADRVARASALREEVLALAGDAYTPRF